MDVRGQEKVSEFGELGEITVPYFPAEGGQGEFAFAGDRDKSSLLKLIQVVGERCRSDGDAFAQVGTGAVLLPGDALQDAVARGIGDGLVDGAKLCARQRR